MTETINKGILKINLLDWLKKSPVEPSYSASQKKSKKSGTAAASDVDPMLKHDHYHLFPLHLLSNPEFRFENKLDSLRPKDKAALVEYLEMQEKAEADAKEAAEKAAAEAAGANAAAVTGKGGKDAKKVEKKPPPKGAPVDDKNAP